MKNKAFTNRNQAQNKKSLRRAREANAEYIRKGDFSDLSHVDRFKNHLPSEVAQEVTSWWTSVAPSERKCFSKFIVDNSNRVCDFRTNENYGAEICLNGDTVNRALNKLARCGMLNKVKRHKFGTAFYGLSPSLKKSSVRKLLEDIIPAFKVMCLGVLLSATPADLHCQKEMRGHINQEKKLNLKALYRNIEENVSSVGPKTFISKNVSKEARFSTPEVRPLAIQRTIKNHKGEVVSSFPANYIEAMRRMETLYSHEKEIRFALETSPEDQKIVGQFFRTTEEADKFARLNIKHIHTGRYKELYEYNQSLRRQKFEQTKEERQWAREEREQRLFNRGPKPQPRDISKDLADPVNFPIEIRPMIRKMNREALLAEEIDYRQRLKRWEDLGR